MFGRPNPGAFEAALRCQNTEAKRPGPVKLLSRTRWVNKDLLVSGALAGFALPHELHSISGLQLQRRPALLTAERVLGP